MATYLLFIAGGLCLLLIGGALLIIKRQHDDLAAKAKELKRQKFITNRARIAEEIASRLQGGFVSAAAHREPLAEPQKCGTPATGRQPMPPASPSKSDGAPQLRRDISAVPPRGEEAPPASQQPLQYNRAVNNGPLPDGTKATIPAEQQPLYNPAEGGEEPDIPLGVKPELTAAAQSEREQVASTSINAASLTGLLAEANRSRHDNNSQPPDSPPKASLPEALPREASPVAEANAAADKISGNEHPLTPQPARKDVKAGRGLPPYATPPTVKLPPVKQSPVNPLPVNQSPEKAAPAATPTPPAAAARILEKAEPPQPRPQNQPKTPPAEQHVTWQTLTREGTASSERNSPLNGAAPRVSMLPGQPAISQANGTTSSTASIRPFHPNPELSLYDQLAAYASWVASQSEQFILERHAKDQPHELIPLLMTKEDLQRLNGHWFGLFKPRDLTSLYKEMQRNECEIYIPFNQGDITELKRPAEEILAYVEEEDSPRYRQVIKESKLAEFITFLDELDNIV